MTHTGLEEFLPSMEMHEMRERLESLLSLEVASMKRERGIK
jgi:hypothetical protein